MVTPGRTIFILSHGNVKQSSVFCVVMACDARDCTVRLKVDACPGWFGVSFAPTGNGGGDAYLQHAIFRSATGIACLSEGKLRMMAAVDG